MKKNILITLTMVFTVLFAVSTFFICKHLQQENQSQILYDELATAVTETAESVEPADSIQPFENETILAEYAELYRENKNMVGWISVPDTQINYPVVQTPDEPDYYLRRDFYGNYAICGCPYVQEDCDVMKPSDNIVIYGHNMRNGTMFGELDKYESKFFWENHKTLFFNTLMEKQEYEVVAVFKTSVNNDRAETFKYNHFVNAENKADYDHFIEQCKKLAFYDTGVDTEYGDKFITLSTCASYSTDDNERLVLVGKQI